MDNDIRAIVNYNYKDIDELQASQHFVEAELDYSTVEKHRQMLDQLSSTGNMSGWIFDTFRRQYIHASHNSINDLGLDFTGLTVGRDANGFGEVANPQDFALFVRTRLDFYVFLLTLPAEQRKDYKLVHSIRMRGAQDGWIRYLFRQHVLELDPRGNIWLILGLMELDPSQDPGRGFECSVINIKTGQKTAVGSQGNGFHLTAREMEVLQLMKDGLLSKEISGRLSISVHTVNIHRQNILRKTRTGNAIEAIAAAVKTGLM